MGVAYTTREAVKADLDYPATARANADVDRAIQGASRSAEGLCRRVFYPVLETRYFDYYPDPMSPGRLWLEANDLISLSALSSGGVAVLPAYVIPYPLEGPPFNELQLDRSTSATWTVGSTPQRNFAATGLWGWNDDRLPSGDLATTVNDSLTTLVVSPSDALGVGSLLSCGTERMIVTHRRFSVTGETTVGTMDADVADQIMPGHDVAKFVEGDVLLLDAEKVRVAEIAGTSLIVERSVDGTALAAHVSGTVVYALRTLTVQRGALGTTAVVHTAGDDLTVWETPALLEEWVAAMAIDTLLQKGSGYSRTVGSGDGEREAGGRALTRLQEKALALYKRWLS
jgi:hypothetical protein